MARTKDVRHKLIELVAGVAGLDAVDGAGDPIQVKSGRYTRPPGVPPFACVWTQQVDETQGPTLSQREQTGTFMIQVFVSALPKDPAARQDEAEDMMDDVRAALRASPRLGNLVTQYTVSAASWEAEQETGKVTFSSVLLAVSATWREP